MTIDSQEKRQFKALYRGFLGRFLDLEILSSRGDTQQLLVQIGALLSAFSFVLALWKTRQYTFASSKYAPEQIMAATWGDQASLISITITVTGLFTVLMWDSLFPDRRDSLVLSALPIRMRTLFAAKSAAIGTAAGLSFLSVNVFTGLSYPFLLESSTPGLLGSLRSFGAYWIAMAGAAVFVFCALLSMQGLALHTLSHSRFARVSSYLQVGAFFVLVVGFFLLPPIVTPSGLADPANGFAFAAIPAFWFTGLFQQLAGAQHPAFRELAQHAAIGLAVAAALAILTYTTAYTRHIRRVIEASGTIPADQRLPASRLTQWLVHRIAPRALDRALFLFITRTLLRSRQHRMILALYGGLALGFSLVYLDELIHPRARRTPIDFLYSAGSWFMPNPAMLAASLVILCLAIVGIRVCFALPIELRANWVFRLTETSDLAVYVRAIRKALWFLAPIPLGIATAIVLFALWPARLAIAHLILFSLVGALLIERSLTGFHKIPFTCSYLPGKANLTVMLGVYATLFMFFADVGIRIELWSFRMPVRYVAIAAILSFFIYRTIRKNAGLIATADTGLTFDERPPAELQLLELQSAEAYYGRKIVSAPPPTVPHAIRRFLLKAAAGLAIVAAGGFLYEQFEEWRGRALFPPPGRRVDIGGRSLQLACAGQGAPAIILESGANNGGVGWQSIQPRLAELAQTCWFARAGFGDSDPGPLPRDSVAVADDLRQLLRAAGIAPPYILVGHSKAAMDIRVYAGKYRNEVAGLVFVDPSHEDQDQYTPESLKGPANKLPAYVRAPLIRVFPALARLGIVRMMSETPGFEGLSAAESDAIHADRMQAKSEIAGMHEGLVWTETAEQARAAGRFGNLPLVVLSAGHMRERVDKEVREAFDVMIHKLHPEIARLSSNGRQVIVEDSGHGIQYERPAAVVDAVRDVMAAVRADSVHP